MNKIDSLKLLDNYFKDIKFDKKLTYVEASKLCINMYDTQDNKERLSIREQILNGTMYKIYEILYYIANNDFDMYDISLDDIISDVILIYLEALDNKEFVDNYSFIRFFNRDIYIRLNSKYNKYRFSRSNLYEYFINLFEWYYKTISIYGDVSINDFYNYCVSLNKINSYEIYYLYTIIKNLYDELDEKDIDNKLDYVKKFKDIILSVLMDYYIDMTNLDDDKIEDILNSMIESDIRSLLNNLGDRRKSILIKKLGFNCEKMTINELTLEFGISQSNISKKYSSALKCIEKRNSKKLKKLRLLYDGSKKIN